MEYKHSSEFTKCEWRSDIYTETGADYSLPDYNGDVRRILFTSADVRPSGSFDSGDSIDFSGIVVYNMVYSDSENKINSVSFTSDYDLSVKCDTDKCKSNSADISVANYSMRLLGPRKISAKATLMPKVVISKTEKQEIEGSAFCDGSSPEVEVATLEIASVVSSDRIEREYAEELVRFDGESADDIAVIFTDAECIIDSVTGEEDSASVKGNMRVYAILKCGEEPMFLAEKNIRIDENLPFENLNRGIKISPDVTVSSVRCAVSADEGGCSVVANVIIDLGAEIYANEQVELVTDAYRRDGETENSYEKYDYLEICTVISEKEEFNHTLSREDIEIENLREVICISAKPKIERCEVVDGVAQIAGEIKYSGIASGMDDSGELSYSPFKIALPFEKNVNLNCQNGAKIRVSPSICSTMANVVIDENNLHVSSLSQTKLFVCEEKSVKVLKQSELLESGEFAPLGAKITVYYPEERETLFEIAKKFHTTAEKISKDNSISRAVSADADARLGVKRLLIF